MADSDCRHLAKARRATAKAGDDDWITVGCAATPIASGRRAIDLGNEPPLSVDGGTGGVIDRRRISVQWFSGTILTGVCGAALMGGAVFASLDGETNFATVPERVENTLRGAISALGEKFANRKSDRLPPVGEANAPAQDHPDQHHRPRRRPRGGARAALSCACPPTCRWRPSEFAASVPPFNAQKLLAQAGADGVPTDDQPGAEPDAEVSYVTRELAGLLPRVKVGAALPIDDIIARVRDTANWTGGAQPRYQVASLPPAGAPLAYAAEGTPDPYAGFETRIVPENITMLPKTGNQITGGNAWNERSSRSRRARASPAILKEIGATPDEIKAIASALGPRGRDNGLKEGQKLRILVAAADAAAHAADPRDRDGRQRHRGGGRAVGQGRYVSVDVASMNTRWPKPATTRRTTARACGSIRASTRPRCATRFRAR